MWLEDHLITPIQRIPRYILLLRDLLKYTPSTHADAPRLRDAVARMEALAGHINEMKKRSEKSVMMIMVQRIVKHCPAIVTPARQVRRLSYVCLSRVYVNEHVRVSMR